MSQSASSFVSAFSHLGLGREIPSAPPRTNPKAFRDGRTPRATDVFIAVMGVTGSGKSAFISLCCAKLAEVGHRLRSCTITVDVYIYDVSPQQTVYLIDTPGFDDTNRSDTEVLREIASWLTDSYSNKILLHGIIYLHRISDPRMQGSAKKNLLMFKKLCGEDALRKVILATTMWDTVDHNTAQAREEELVSTPEYWGYMMSKGSAIHRHDNSAKSARDIVERLTRGNSKVTLDIQSQMVNERRELIETGAGKELESELIKERKKWARELDEVRDQMTEAIQLKDRESELALREVKDDYTNRMKRLEKENKRLHVDTKRLHSDRIEKLEKALEMQNTKHYKEIKKLHQEHIKQETARIKLQQASTPPPTILTPKLKPKASALSTNNQTFSLSLYGNSFSICGPRQSLQNCMATSAYEEVKKLMISSEWSLCFFACGTKNCWVYKYRNVNGSHSVRWSTNLSAEYPLLHDKLVSETSTEGPIYISLGPGETFYSQFTDYRFWCVASAIERRIHAIKHEGITIVALGMNDTCVIVTRRRWSTHLKGYYGGVAKSLRNSTSDPRAIALNIENTSDFIIVSGTLRYSLRCSLGRELHPQFLEWKKVNSI